VRREQATAKAKANAGVLRSAQNDKRWGRTTNVEGYEVDEAMSRGLEGGEDDGYDYEAEEEAAAVGDGVDDGVFVELAAGGEEPETADP
jgi:hypothetical protein